MRVARRRLVHAALDLGHLEQTRPSRRRISAHRQRPRSRRRSGAGPGMRPRRSGASVKARPCGTGSSLKVSVQRRSRSGLDSSHGPTKARAASLGSGSGYGLRSRASARPPLASRTRANRDRPGSSAWRGCYPAIMASLAAFREPVRALPLAGEPRYDVVGHSVRPSRARCTEAEPNAGEAPRSPSRSARAPWARRRTRRGRPPGCLVLQRRDQRRLVDHRAARHVDQDALRPSASSTAASIRSGRRRRPAR